MLLDQNYILLLASKYSAHTGIGETSLAQSVMNDRSFFRDIRSGRSNTIKTYTSVLQWFSDNWPDGLAWPDEIERPLITEFEQSPNSANGGCDVPFRHNPPNPLPVSKVTDTIKEKV